MKMGIKEENIFSEEPKINKKTMKIRSFTEITLSLILILSTCIVNLSFTDLNNFDHKLILQVQKYFYSFATNSICSTFSNIIDHWIFHPDSINSILTFIYFSFSPFLAFKLTIIFNIFLVFTEALDFLLYRQPRPF